MNLVWESAPYGENTLLTLLALADWADDDGICWPKVSQLCDKTRQSERNVRYCLAKLMDEKVLNVIAEADGPGRPRKFQIGGQFLPPTKEKGGQFATRRGAIIAEKGGNLRQRNKEEPSLNHQEPSAPPGFLARRSREKHERIEAAKKRGMA